MKNWKNLDNEKSLEEIIDNTSHQKPVVIFKHSTRCPISSNAMAELSNNWDIPVQEADFFFLDLISHRKVSNAVAQELGVLHESPQVILVANGKAIYSASHWNIKTEAIKKVIP